MSHDPEQTYQIGRRLSQEIAGGHLVLLRGPLGAGKTVLARGLAEGLGVSNWRGSPTFTLINEYDITPSLYHADLYRLEQMDIQTLGLEEYARPDSIMVVEWADRDPVYLAGLGRGETIWVDMDLIGPAERVVRFTRQAASEPVLSACERDDG